MKSLPGCADQQPDQLLTAFQRDSFHEQVCLYFVNLVLEDYENYNFWHTPDMLERRNMYPHRFSPIRETFHVPVPRPAHAYLVSVVRYICLEGSVTDQIRSKCLAALLLCEGPPCFVDFLQQNEHHA